MNKLLKFFQVILGIIVTVIFIIFFIKECYEEARTSFLVVFGIMIFISILMDKIFYNEIKEEEEED